MIDKKRIENAVKEILSAIGEDLQREGLIQTPKRVANMYAQILSGMKEDPNVHVKVFNEPTVEGQFVQVNKIPVYSVCEHHMLPFVGLASIVYLPKDGKIIGISKLARIVDCFSRRLQVQERLTSEIANFVWEKIGARGVVVKIEAEHLCMTMRGVKAMNAKTKTVSYKGEFETNAELRLLAERSFSEK